MNIVKIPNQENKISQPNNSDLFGNIYYTKSINLDEPGYIKLSSRSVSLIDSRSTPDFNLPVSFGRQIDGAFNVTTLETEYELTITEQALGIVEDGDAPDLDPTTRGCWFENFWHISTQDSIWKRDPGGTWSQPVFNLLNSDFPHPLETFRSRRTLCVGDGNLVRQYQYDPGDNYIVDTLLTLPPDYTVIGLKYSNGVLGITTKLSSEAAGQNQQAFFFTWNGAQGNPNQEIPVGSDMTAALISYASSFALLNRNGDFDYFNGGGFEKLVNLPFSYFNYHWGDSDNLKMVGDTIDVDGGGLYMNVPTSLNPFTNKSQRFLPNYPGGILCYDPSVILYHRYAPSISPMWGVAVNQADVNITNNSLATNNELNQTGDPVIYTSDGDNQIGGLKVGTVYYAIIDTSTEFRLALTKQDAIDGNAINLTSQGASVNYFMFVQIRDYGASLTPSRTGAIVQMGINNLVYDHLMFGGEYTTYDSSDTYAHLNITVPFFRNIGYFVTAKDVSDNITDNYIAFIVKNRPLADTDRIIVKAKMKDVYNIPVTTPQMNMRCEWASETTLETSADISEVVTYLNADTDHECECEITNGAGAGQMSQIEDITIEDGVYTITLTDSMEGVSEGDACDILIDNWKLFGEITSDNNSDGYTTFPFEKNGKWAKAKVIMDGVNITIEEANFVSDVDLSKQK